MPGQNILGNCSDGFSLYIPPPFTIITYSLTLSGSYSFPRPTCIGSQISTCTVSGNANGEQDYNGIPETLGASDPDEFHFIRAGCCSTDYDLIDNPQNSAGTATYIHTNTDPINCFPNVSEDESLNLFVQIVGSPDVWTINISGSVSFGFLQGCSNTAVSVDTSLGPFTNEDLIGSHNIVVLEGIADWQSWDFTVIIA